MRNTEDSSRTRQHHYLVAGEIYFRLPAPEGQEDQGIDMLQSVRLNVLSTSVDQKLPLRQVNKIQQALQMRFMERMGDPNITIIDVVLLEFSYLGQFTQAEFNKPPAGAKLELVQPSNAPLQ